MIRNFLLSLLGFDRYLNFISYIFLKTFVKKIYLKDHEQVRFLSKLVKTGDVCIDIGANLGYFTVPLSLLTKDAGKVYAIEPVETFREVLFRNIAYFAGNNVEVLPFALGEQNEIEIQMATPTVAGRVRHGMTKVVEKQADNTYKTHSATMYRPDTLLQHLDKLDFVKCDVEGYEIHIIPLFINIFRKFRPILEIESDGINNKTIILNHLLPLDYAVFYLENEKLKPYSIENQNLKHIIELYFIPKEKIASLQSLL